MKRYTRTFLDKYIPPFGLVMLVSIVGGKLINSLSVSGSFIFGVLVMWIAFMLWTETDKRL